MTTLGTAVALAACASGGNAELAAAQARVEDSQAALVETQEEAAAATEQFCSRSEAYVAALDRYADVLHDTAPTVGDVRNAGTDLQQPQQIVVDGAEDAVAARNAVVEAESELVAAQDELAQLTAATPGAAPVSEVPTGSATTLVPEVPEATMNRVKEAERDFGTAVSGVSDDTPLVEASQQVNAAAVALELSWLRLLADVDCLTNEQQKQAEAAVRDYTLALQKSLKTAGYYNGEVDGIYGPKTVEAVETLQKENELPVTGAVDKHTDLALQAAVLAQNSEAQQEAIATTAAVQQTLILAGYYNGPVDGEWTDDLTASVKALQADLGVKETGEVDAATVSAIQRAIETAQQPPSPPPPAEPAEPAPSEVPSETSS